jgi:hypothetical protein
MDEMLFAFCDPGDSVLTATRMNAAHADYLHAIGFQFNHNRFDLFSPDDSGNAQGVELAPSVFQCMRDQKLSEPLAPFFTEGARLEPFAVVPGTAEVARQFRLGGVFPAQDVIRSVNTKSYSVRMRERLGIPNVGLIVEDVASLLDAGSSLLRQGSFLIKDDYGVSGKGNQLIETERALQRIARYLAAQTAAGKRVRFVLEPFLSKVSDFSCQFRIEQDRHVTVLCVQELGNNGLAFGASRSAPPELLERLDRDGYFQLMERIGWLMHGDGYCGDVCIDSMILRDGTMAPLVEINARKSMSLIKHAIDRHLEKSGRRGCLTYVSAVNHASTGYSGLLDLLETHRLLFTLERESGIVPLTAGTLYPSSIPELHEPVMGKLYMAVVCEKSAEQGELLKAAGHVMELAGLRVMR